MEIKSFKLRDIRLMYHDPARYPLDPGKVNALAASIKADGLQPTLRGRFDQDDPSKCQISDGRHRMAALEKLKWKKPVPVIIEPLSSADMLRLMTQDYFADEDMPRYAGVQQEAVREALLAFERGEIDLPFPKSTAKSAITHTSEYLDVEDKPFTVKALGHAMGWLKRDGRPMNKLGVLLRGLTLIKQGTLKSDFGGRLSLVDYENEVRAAEQERESLKRHEDQPDDGPVGLPSEDRGRDARGETDEPEPERPAHRDAGIGASTGWPADESAASTINEVEPRDPSAEHKTGPERPEKSRNDKEAPDLVIVIRKWTDIIENWSKQLDAVTPHREYIQEHHDASAKFREAVVPFIKKLQQLC